MDYFYTDVAVVNLKIITRNEEAFSKFTCICPLVPYKSLRVRKDLDLLITAWVALAMHSLHTVAQ